MQQFCACISRLLLLGRGGLLELIVDIHFSCQLKTNAACSNVSTNLRTPLELALVMNLEAELKYICYIPLGEMRVCLVFVKCEVKKVAKYMACGYLKLQTPS
jgi:hypothetical protein